MSPAYEAVALYFPIGKSVILYLYPVPFSTSTVNVVCAVSLKVTVTVPFKLPHAPSVNSMRTVWF